jgi:hypothetical protein
MNQLDSRAIRGRGRAGGTHVEASGVVWAPLPRPREHHRSRTHDRAEG